MMLVPLHAGFANNPGFWSWQAEPAAIVGIALAGILYFRWLRRHEIDHPGEQAASGLQQFAFVAGLATYVVALLSPVDTFASYLLTMHMVQHILLTIIGPPLLLLGLPRGIYRSLSQRGTFWSAWRWLTKPFVAFVLFNAVFSFIHLPVLYNLLLSNEIFHIASHLALMGTALLAWWPVLAAGREFGELNPAVKSLYLLAHTVPGVLVGGVITLVDSVLYSEYAHAPLRLWDLSLKTDQEIGGLLMWVGVGSLYLGAAAIAFFRWAAEADNRERSRITKPNPVQ